jgi:hypothetical protein
MTANEVHTMLEDNAVVPLWPEAGRALGLTRGAAYRGGVTGDIRVMVPSRMLVGIIARDLRQVEGS